MNNTALSIRTASSLKACLFEIDRPADDWIGISIFGKTETAINCDLLNKTLAFAEPLLTPQTFHWLSTDPTVSDVLKAIEEVK